MAFVGPLHCERISLLAFAQRLLARFNAPQLAQQRQEGKYAEQGNQERAHRQSGSLVAPAMQCDSRFPSDREYQRGVANAGDGKEVPRAIDRAHKFCHRGARAGRNLRIIASQDVRGARDSDQ
jgi:hypothetical protein